MISFASNNHNIIITREFWNEKKSVYLQQCVNVNIETEPDMRALKILFFLRTGGYHKFFPNPKLQVGAPLMRMLSSSEQKIDVHGQTINYLKIGKGFPFLCLPGVLGMLIFFQ